MAAEGKAAVGRMGGASAWGGPSIISSPAICPPFCPHTWGGAFQLACPARRGEALPPPWGGAGFENRDGRGCRGRGPPSAWRGHRTHGRTGCFAGFAPLGGGAGKGGLGMAGLRAWARRGLGAFSVWPCPRKRLTRQRPEPRRGGGGKARCHGGRRTLSHAKNPLAAARVNMCAPIRRSRGYGLPFWGQGAAARQPGLCGERPRTPCPAPSEEPRLMRGKGGCRERAAGAARLAVTRARPPGTAPRRRGCRCPAVFRCARPACIPIGPPGTSCPTRP